MMDLFCINTQIFTSQDVNWWTGVVWIACRLLWCFHQLFDGTHSLRDTLVSKWCDVKAAVYRSCLFVTISVWKPGIAAFCGIIFLARGWESVRLQHGWILCFEENVWQSVTQRCGCLLYFTITDSIRLGIYDPNKEFSPYIAIWTSK